MKNQCQEKGWTPYIQIMLLKASFFLKQRINIFSPSSFTCCPSILQQPAGIRVPPHSATAYSWGSPRCALQADSLSLGLAATSALARHHRVIFWLLAWHLRLCCFWPRVCLALKLNQHNRAQLKRWQAGSPLHNASSADERDAAPHGQPPEPELPSGLPLHGRRPSLKLLQFLKWLPDETISWGNELAEHGNVHPLDLNVLTSPQMRNILHPFDAVHNTRERGCWCAASQVHHIRDTVSCLGNMAGGAT